MTSKSIFTKRQKAARAKLSLWKVDGFLCENVVDIFYLTGMQLSLGRLLVLPKSTILFVDGRYLSDARKKAHCTVRQLSDEALSRAVKGAKVLGFDTQTSYARVKALKTLKTRLKGLQRPIKALRAVKDVSELRLIRESAQLLWKGFLHAKKCLKVGIEEQEVALEFEFYCRKKGAEGVSFDPIIAFGTHTALPHYHTGSRRLKKGDIVLMDLGVKLKGYASDMTRTFFFGEGKRELKTLMRVVEQSKKAALELCAPGVALCELDAAARQVMKQAGFEKHFLHSLGHGIGLDVHELPNFRDEQGVLEPGMVITIEPGLYLAGKGGVRLEDMVIVTKSGYENLFR